MRNTIVKNLSLWQFDHLLEQPGIMHFVTDRQSDREGDPFTLSYSSHPDRDFIERNRRKLASAVSVAADRLVFPSQTHGTRIVSVTSETKKEELMETDALITSERNLCIAVMSADCVPVLLYDYHRNVVAAVHAGWRGTVAKIVAKTVQAMKDNFSSEPHQVLAAIGPSICQDSYEVGEEVVAAVEDTFGSAHTLLQPTTPGKAKLDLWTANRIQLADAGIPSSNIEVAGLCTVKNNNYFFSARKGDKGRFAAGVMLI